MEISYKKTPMTSLSLKLAFKVVNNLLLIESFLSMNQQMMKNVVGDILMLFMYVLKIS